MPLKPSGITPTTSPRSSSRSASSAQARVCPALRASSLTTGSMKTRSAASSRRCRSAGWLSCTATCIISPSSGSVPEWLATTSAPPSAGMFSMPFTSTRKYFSYSGRSSDIRTWSVSSSS